jgi:hypothetical protein
VVEREDREQWPSRSVVRAFLEGKIHHFKAFTEEQSGDDPKDKKWNARWTTFMDSLEKVRDDEEEMKRLSSAFMTAQRAKRWRRGKKD